MSKKYKIIIQGIGGVGGYIGARLSKAYIDSDTVEVFLAARGENEKAIRENGLKLITDEAEIQTKAKLLNDETEDFNADLIISSTKSYDLESSLLSLEKHIGDQTLILPLLNGVDASERISKLFPDTKVLLGCIYIVARRTAPAFIQQSGKNEAIYFGSSEINPSALEKIDRIMKEAGLKSHYSRNISDIVWEKFFFISTIATLTSYLDLNIAEIMADNDSEYALKGLMYELKQIAEARQIPLPENVIEKTLNKLRSMPAGATSSMHSDFKAGNRTELESLCGYVIRLGKSMGLSAPNYELMYNALQGRLLQQN